MVDGCSVVHGWALAGAVVELIGHVISITTREGDDVGTDCRSSHCRGKDLLPPAGDRVFTI